MNDDIVEEVDDLSRLSSNGPDGARGRGAQLHVTRSPNFLFFYIGDWLHIQKNISCSCLHISSAQC